MPRKRRISRVLDEHRFHGLATEVQRQQSGLGALLLVGDLRIRGVNESFPDDPNDPQAKGMLMERFDVDAAAAFDLLVTLSEKSNTPLAVIAQKLVEIDHPST